jgi:hypothetical protein
MKHNADLCPRIGLQIEAVLNAFGRFEPIVYDTQGFLDDGVDLAVRVERERPESGDTPHVVGFQIKSYDDFRRKGMLRDLKAQHDDARRKVLGLREHFILLCTDEHEHKEAIRTVEAEFRSAPDTFIIEPTFAHRFMTMPPRRVQGLIGRAMQAEDVVFRRALETVDLGRVSAGVLAVYVAAKVLDGAHDVAIDDLVRDPTVTQAYAELREAIERGQELALEGGTGATLQALDGDDEEDAYEEEERLRLLEEELAISRLTAEDLVAHDLELLDTRLVDVDSTAASLSVRSKDIMPLVALLADARVRYNLLTTDVVSYGLNALGLLELS